MELIRSRFCGDRYSGAARYALLRIEAAGGNVNLFDALHRRHVNHMVRHRDKDVRSTVNARIVGTAFLTIDSRRKITLRSVDHCVLEPNWRGSGHKIYQGLEITVAG